MTEHWRIHTLVFDLDDTLYPEQEFVLGGFEAAGNWLREKQDVDGFAAVAKKLFVAGRRGRIFDEALPLVGIEHVPKLVAELIGAYREHAPQLALFPDAIEILEWAVARFQLALITDGYAAVQTRKISALALEERIPCRIITDELGRAFWKPSPEPFRRVMGRYPGAASGYVYVADNPRKDFIGAKQLGWRTVRIRRPGGEHTDYQPTAAEAADIEIADLRPLRHLLQSAASVT